MPVNHFDQASRFAAKLDSAEFVRWVLDLTPGGCEFCGWLDTRDVPFPGGADRVSDTVAHLTDTWRHGLPWAVVIEFQSQHDPTMFARLLAYLSGVWLHCKPDEERGSRFRVGAAVVNLTDSGAASRDMHWPEAAGLRTCLRAVERNLCEESAADLLARIEDGRWARTLLPWIPLMSGGDSVEIIERWKVLALAEPDRRRRAELGGLALVFAEKAKREDVWKQKLEGWNVEESTVVKEWQAIAEQRGETRGKEIGGLEEARASVLRFAAKKFGAPDEAAGAAVAAISDRGRLERMQDRLFEGTATGWADLLATA